MLRNIFTLLFLVGFAFVAQGAGGKGGARPPQPNQQQLQQQQQMLQQLMQQQQQMIQQRLQQMQQQAMYQRGGRPGYRAPNNKKGQPQPKENVTEYEFVMADEGVVRTMMRPEGELDDNGKPKKLDAEELKKLKGDSPEERKFTGYKATLEDVQVGDEVIVTLSRHKPVPKSARKKADADDEETPKAKAKAKAKDADDEEKPKEKKEKAKDADDEEKPKAKGKAKAKDGDDEEKPKAKGKDEDEKEVRKIDLSMWRPVGKLQGTVSEVTAAGSARLTIRVVRPPMPQAPGYGQQQQPQQNQGPQRVTIDPSNMQGTVLIISRRAAAGAGAGGDGGFGFGQGGK